jgi:hypothetical protein
MKVKAAIKARLAGLNNGLPLTDDPVLVIFMRLNACTYPKIRFPAMLSSRGSAMSQEFSDGFMNLADGVD